MRILFFFNEEKRLKDSLARKGGMGQVFAPKKHLFPRSRVSTDSICIYLLTSPDACYFLLQEIVGNTERGQSSIMPDSLKVAIQIFHISPN